MVAFGLHQYDAKQPKRGRKVPGGTGGGEWTGSFRRGGVLEVPRPASGGYEVSWSAKTVAFRANCTRLMH